MDTNNSFNMFQTTALSLVPDLIDKNGYSLDKNSRNLSSAAAQVAYFGAGNDIINLGDSNSNTFAGEGNNVVLGGLGNHKIYAGAGNDFINAGDGNNSVIAGDGNNRVLTGKGKDTIYAGAGNDVIYSGAGDDFIDAGNGTNLINAGTGNDTVTLGSGQDTIILEAGEGSVTINGFNTAVDKLRLGESLLGKSLTFTSSNGDTLVRSGRDLLATLKGVGKGSQALIDRGPLTRYQATDLGSLAVAPGVAKSVAAVNAASINDFGVIAGRYNTGEVFANTSAAGVTNANNAIRQGFVFADGVQTALTSTGVKNGQSDNGAASGATVTLLTPNINTINNRGDILGTADEVRQPVPKATDRALRFQNDGSGYKLTINDFGGIESYFFDSNNRDQQVGRNIVEEKDAAGVTNEFDRAIFINNGQVTRLADLGGNGGTAQKISKDGKTIVGYLDSDNTLDDKQTYTAAVWQLNDSGQFVLTDLGTFGDEQARLRDINNAGQIIGNANSGTGVTATSTPFLLRNGEFTAIGSLGGKTGAANGINEFGQVVGTSQIAAGTNRAYVWNAGVQSDLNSLIAAPLTVNGAAVTLTSAVGINNFGDIVATGTYTYKNDKGVDTVGTRSFVLKEIA